MRPFTLWGQPFRARVDWWLFTFLILVLMVATVLVAQGVIERPGPTSGVILALATVTDVFFLWILLGTRYEVSPRGLRVYLGPLRWTFPADQIQGVRPGTWQYLFSGPGRVRAALSTSNLVVQVRQGPEVKEVVLSPLEPGAFLDALRQTAPHASIPQAQGKGGEGRARQ